MESKSGAGSDVGLKIVLGVLVLFIIVLGTTFVLTRINGITLIGDNGDGSSSEDGVNVVLLTEEIDDKLYSDPNYGYEQAAEDYRAAMAIGDNQSRLSVAFAFARYDYSVFHDTGRAVGIIRGVEDLADDDFKKYTYYGYLLYFYNQGGYEEEAAEVSRIMDGLSPRPDLNREEGA